MLSFLLHILDSGIEIKFHIFCERSRSNSLKLQKAKQGNFDENIGLVFF